MVRVTAQRAASLSLPVSVLALGGETKPDIQTRDSEKRRTGYFGRIFL